MPPRLRARRASALIPVERRRPDVLREALDYPPEKNEFFISIISSLLFFTQKIKKILLYMALQEVYIPEHISGSVFGEQV